MQQSGRLYHETAEADGIALAGKPSIRFKSKLRLPIPDRAERVARRLRRCGVPTETIGCRPGLWAGARMLQGPYKVQMPTVHRSRRGVRYVYDGHMVGCK